jgi:hypothetical protein
LSGHGSVVRSASQDAAETEIGEDTTVGEKNSKGCGCCGGGILGSIGAVLAALLSWNVNHSILWALVHAFFSWFYVIYHWIKYGQLLP